jgi:peptide/nickel transport system substrate-binding protein
MFTLRKHLLLGVLSLVLLAFVANAALTAEDPVTIGQTFLAGSMDPTDGSNGWSLTSHGISEKLFTVDEDGEIVPQVAESLSKVDENTWDIKLKDGYKFSDGTPVDAQHVVDALTDLNTNNDSAQSSLGVMTVTVGADNHTVRIVSERPSHVMDAVLAEWVFTVFMKDADGNFLFTGPFAVEAFGSDKIELVPNPHYIDGKSLDRPSIELQKFADGHDLAEAAKNNEIDIGFHLPIDTLVHLREMDGVNVKSFEVGYHYMMFHNLDSISDVNVRKAIDLAIDRTALSQVLSGGTGTRSLFPDYSPYYSDDSDPHGHADDAAALLDEAGWTLNADTGKREKDGEPLTITLVAYPHRPGLVIMQPVIADSLEALGFEVNAIVTGMDWGETATIMSDRSFDLLMWAQHTLPAGDPLWFLSSFFRSDGGNNHANLQSTDVDAMLDSLSNAEVHSDRVELAASTQEEILSNVPVSNLVTPFWHVSLSDRMADYKPWGSDYYVVRADLFATVVETNGDLDPEPVVEKEEEHDSHEDEKEEEHDSHDHGSHDHGGASDDEVSGAAVLSTGLAAIVAGSIAMVV